MKVFEQEAKFGIYIEVKTFRDAELLKETLIEVQKAVVTGNGGELSPVKVIELPSQAVRKGELPVYVSGRCTPGTVEHGDNQVYNETIAAMDVEGWDLKPAAKRLVIGYDTLRSRLYAYARKGLVVRIGKDRWRGA